MAGTFLCPVISERARGFEPLTSSLGSWHSTTELRPPRMRSNSLRPLRRACQLLAMRDDAINLRILSTHGFTDNRATFVETRTSVKNSPRDEVAPFRASMRSTASNAEEACRRRSIASRALRPIRRDSIRNRRLGRGWLTGRGSGGPGGEQAGRGPLRACGRAITMPRPISLAAS